MDIYTATEVAFKNGYEKGKQEQTNISFGVQECSKCQYKLRCDECVYNEKDISELIKFEKQQAHRETAEKIITSIKYCIDEQCCNKNEMLILNLCNGFAKQYNVEIKEQENGQTV